MEDENSQRSVNSGLSNTPLTKSQDVQLDRMSDEAAVCMDTSNEDPESGDNVDHAGAMRKRAAEADAKGKQCAQTTSDDAESNSFVSPPTVKRGRMYSIPGVMGCGSTQEEKRMPWDHNSRSRAELDEMARKATRMSLPPANIPTTQPPPPLSHTLGHRKRKRGNRHATQGGEDDEEEYEDESDGEYESEEPGSRSMEASERSQRRQSRRGASGGPHELEPTQRAAGKSQSPTREGGSTQPAFLRQATQKVLDDEEGHEEEEDNGEARSGGRRHGESPRSSGRRQDGKRRMTMEIRTCPPTQIVGEAREDFDNVAINATQLDSTQPYGTGSCEDQRKKRRVEDKEGEDDADDDVGASPMQPMGQATGSQDAKSDDCSRSIAATVIPECMSDPEEEKGDDGDDGEGDTESNKKEGNDEEVKGEKESQKQDEIPPTQGDEAEDAELIPAAGLTVEGELPNIIDEEEFGFALDDDDDDGQVEEGQEPPGGKPVPPTKEREGVSPPSLEGEPRSATKTEIVEPKTKPKGDEKTDSPSSALVKTKEEEKNQTHLNPPPSLLAAPNASDPLSTTTTPTSSRRRTPRSRPASSRLGASSLTRRHSQSLTPIVPLSQNEWVNITGGGDGNDELEQEVTKTSSFVDPFIIVGDEAVLRSQHEGREGGSCVNNEIFKLSLKTYEDLYEYQRTSVSWLAELYARRWGGILADDMGLGKTVQVAAFLYGLWNSKIGHHFLISVPVTLLGNWQRELTHWCPGLPVCVMHGTVVGRREALRSIVKTGGVLLTSSDLIPHVLHDIKFVQEPPEKKRRKNEKSGRATLGGTQDDNDVIKGNNNLNIGEKQPWDLVVLDEAHRVKNAACLAGQALRCVQSRSRLMLTGTPLQNNLKELWSLMDIVMPSLLGNKKTFETQFSLPIQEGSKSDAALYAVTLKTALSRRLKQIIRPHFMRRVKSSVNEVRLPPKTDIVAWLKMTPEQEKFTNMFLQSDLIAQARAGRAGAAIFKAIQCLQKICNHPILNLDYKHLFAMFYKWGVLVQAPPEGENKPVGWDNDELKHLITDNPTEAARTSCKLSFLHILLEKLAAQGHRCLIFSQSIQMLNLIQSCVLRPLDLKYLRIDGTTKNPERDYKVTKFESEEGRRRFFCMCLSIQVGGVGLTLTSADRVIIVDPAWNPAIDQQAIDRVHRLGQTKPVVVYRLICAGAIEDRMFRLQIFKQGVVKTLLEQENQTRYFAKQDLSDLFNIGEKTIDLLQEKGYALEDEAVIDSICADVGEVDEDNNFWSNDLMDGFCDYSELFRELDAGLKEDEEALKKAMESVKRLKEETYEAPLAFDAPESSEEVEPLCDDPDLNAAAPLEDGSKNDPAPKPVTLDDAKLESPGAKARRKRCWGSDSPVPSKESGSKSSKTSNKPNKKK